MMHEEDYILQLMNGVMDPEIPVLTVNDLGIIRKVTCVVPGKSVEVVITPTYSGCPAMDTISTNIRLALIEHGYSNVMIKQTLSPAWTTDWMTEAGKEKLRAYGISPPTLTRATRKADVFAAPEAVSCPQCSSANTVLISEFGSTACKSLYRCLDCLEPFDHFKCH